VTLASPVMLADPHARGATGNMVAA
jgi:hypothetical protein